MRNRVLFGTHDAMNNFSLRVRDEQQQKMYLSKLQTCLYCKDKAGFNLHRYRRAGPKGCRPVTIVLLMSISYTEAESVVVHYDQKYCTKVPFGTQTHTKVLFGESF